jgi:hypothetical protein
MTYPSIEIMWDFLTTVKRSGDGRALDDVASVSARVSCDLVAAGLRNLLK